MCLGMKSKKKYFSDVLQVKHRSGLFLIYVIAFYHLILFGRVFYYGIMQEDKDHTIRGRCIGLESLNNLAWSEPLEII